MEEYTGEIPVKILELDHSGCPGAVRNSCADHCEGEFLAFLDSDDLWLSDKIETQYNALHRDNSGVYDLSYP